jgi:uncharacterized protein YjbI with pentapeptide repeats
MKILSKNAAVKLLKRDVQAFNEYRKYLYQKNIFDIDLSHANLSGANLFSAHLEGVKFTRAKLKGVDLSGADLSNIIGKYIFKTTGNGSVGREIWYRGE